MSTHIGTGNLFGLTDVTAVSLAGLCQLTHIQNLELNEESDEELVKDGAGVTKIINKSDYRKKLNFEFIPTGASGGTITTGTSITVGATVTVTSTPFPNINDAYVVDSITWTRSNTAAMRARINLTAYTDGALP